MLTTFGYLASVLMGVSLGLIGGGGSILTVPILVYLFLMTPELATGYSLFIVGLTALFASITYIKRGDIDFKVGLTFAVPSFIGVFLSRKYIIPQLPSEILHLGSGWVLTKSALIMLVFSVLMVLASFSMLKKEKPASASSGPQFKGPLRYFIILLEGLIVGGITGFVGAGGGFLIIPALVVLTQIPMKKAVGTSLVIIAIKSLFGFLGDDKALGNFDWTFALTLAAIAIAGSFLGSQLAGKISEAKLKRAFGVFVLLMGAVILTQQIL